MQAISNNRCILCFALTALKQYSNLSQEQNDHCSVAIASLSCCHRFDLLSHLSRNALAECKGWRTCSDDWWTSAMSHAKIAFLLLLVRWRLHYISSLSILSAITSDRGLIGAMHCSCSPPLMFNTNHQQWMACSVAPAESNSQRSL